MRRREREREERTGDTEKKLKQERKREKVYKEGGREKRTSQ